MHCPIKATENNLLTAFTTALLISKYNTEDDIMLFTSSVYKVSAKHFGTTLARERKGTT